MFCNSILKCGRQERIWGHIVEFPNNVYFEENKKEVEIDVIKISLKCHKNHSIKIIIFFCQKD